MVVYLTFRFSSRRTLAVRLRKKVIQELLFASRSEFLMQRASVA